METQVSILPGEWGPRVPKIRGPLGENVDSLYS